MKARCGTREASKCWGNDVTDTLIKEGCKAVVVAPMMFVSENHGYVTVRHGDDFVSCGSAAALHEISSTDDAFRHEDLATHRTDSVWWRGVRKKTPGQNNQMEPSRFRVGVTQQTRGRHGGIVRTETGLKGSTDANHEGEGERTERHR